MPVRKGLRRSSRFCSLSVATLFLGLVLAGCRQDMHDQPVLEPYEGSPVFADGAGNRPLPEGAIARGHLRAERELYTGLSADDTMVSELPMPLTPELLARGRSKFNTFCSPCHDRTGSGRGMIVRRGFKQPASFHDDRLRQQPLGYFFSVITNGFGDMSNYAAQIEPSDRWAIVAYVRTLQWSRSVPLSELPQELRSRAESALAEEQGGNFQPGHGEE